MSLDPLLSRAASFRRARLTPIILVLVLAQIAVGALHLAFSFPLGADLSFPEGALVAGAREAALGRSPYQDWREWPHVFAPYGPLTYYGAGAAARLAGRADDPRFIYLLGRAQSLAALAGICALIALLARPPAAEGKRGALWGVVAIACFFFWGAPMIPGPGPMLSFVASYRPDAPQVFFSILALAIALGGEWTPRRAALAFASLFIAMWWKPTGVGMALALGIWTARARGWRMALVWLAAFAAAGLAAAALLNFVLGGRLFLNMIGSFDNGWRPYNLVRFYTRLELPPLLVLLSGAAAAALNLTKLKKEEPAPLLSLAFLASLGAASLQNLKVGADINYYLEPYALACALAARGLARLWDGTRARLAEETALAALLPALYLMFWASAMGSTRGNLAALKRSWGPLPIANYVASVEGEILTTNPFLALARPAPPTVMDHVQYGILAQRGKLNDEALVARARERRFALVILPAGDPGKPALENESLAKLYSPRLLPELRAHYEEFQRAGVLALLRPKRPAPEPAP